MVSAVFGRPFEPAGEQADASPPAHGSAAEAVGHEILSRAVDLPWDDYLGAGALERVRDGSLGVVRHAYPAGAARDLRSAATDDGRLSGDAALRERVAAVALGVAAAHRRPARMPHPAGEEPHAWWVAEERTLYWLPWAGGVPDPYGLELIESGQADAVVVLAPDAVWTVFLTGLPRRGERGDWATLPERFRIGLATRIPEPLRVGVRWRREADTLGIRWREGGRIRTATIGVNRPTRTEPG
ncbi:MAG: hypothetical protein NVSMB29_18000 [Candidatus Dormibacteria bacterium]